MSACTEIAPLIAFRTLGVLEPRERIQLEEHLATCSSCPGRAEALEQALDVADLPEVRAPEGGWEKIDAAIGEPRALPTVSVACTYCKDAFGSSARVFCAACLAPYHADCFRENGKCAAMGCGETKVVSAQPLPRAARPRAITLLALVLAGGLGVAAWQLRAAHEPPRIAKKPVPENAMPALAGRDYVLLDPTKPALDYFEPEHAGAWKVTDKLLVGDNSGPAGPTSLYFGDDSWTRVEVRLRFLIKQGALAIRVHRKDGKFYEIALQKPKRHDQLLTEWQECRFQLRGNELTYTTSFEDRTSTPSIIEIAGEPGWFAFSLPPGSVVDLEEVTVTLAGDAKAPRASR